MGLTREDFIEQVNETAMLIEEEVDKIYDSLGNIEAGLDDLVRLEPEGTSFASSLVSRARSYWMAHIDGALQNRGGYLGGSFVSFDNTLEELRGLESEMKLEDELREEAE